MTQRKIETASHHDNNNVNYQCSRNFQMRISPSASNYEDYVPEISEEVETVPEQQTVGVRYSQEHIEHMQAMIYSCDFIMENIVRHVTSLKDRSNVELASRRMYKISRSRHTGFAPPEAYRKLEFYFPNFDKVLVSPVIVVSCGGSNIWQRSLTMYSRRCLDGPEQFMQPEPLRNVLNITLRSFSRYVTEISLCERRNSDPEDYEWPQETFIVTKDVIQFIDSFEKLKKLRFKSCLFNSEAVDYIFSNECKFKNRLENCTLDGVTFDEESDIEKLAKIICSNVRNLTLGEGKLESFAEPVLRRIEELNSRLETIRLSAWNVGNVVAGREIVNKFHERCDQLELNFTNPTQKQRHNLIHLLRYVKNWRKVTKLTLNVKTSEVRDIVDLSEILEDLEHLPQLEYLELGGWSDPNLVAYLIKGIENCSKLRSFHFRNRAFYKNFKQVYDLFESLPNGIEELSLDGVPVTNEVMESILERFAGQLRKLSIKNPKKCFILRNVNLILDHMPKLEELAIDVPLPTNLLNKIIDRRNLKDVNLLVDSECSLVLKVLLNDHFERVSIIEKGRNKIWVELRGRKTTASLRLPDKPLLSAQKSAQKPEKKKKEKMSW